MDKQKTDKARLSLLIQQSNSSPSSASDAVASSPLATAYEHKVVELMISNANRTLPAEGAKASSAALTNIISSNIDMKARLAMFEKAFADQELASKAQSAVLATMQQQLAAIGQATPSSAPESIPDSGGKGGSSLTDQQDISLVAASYGPATPSNQTEIQPYAKSKGNSLPKGKGSNPNNILNEVFQVGYPLFMVTQAMEDIPSPLTAAL